MWYNTYMESAPRRLPEALKRTSTVGCMRNFRAEQAGLLKRDVQWLDEYKKRLTGGQSPKFAAIGATAVVFDLKTALALAKS